MGATTARRDKSAFGAAHRRRLARMDTAKAEGDRAPAGAVDLRHAHAWRGLRRPRHRRLGGGAPRTHDRQSPVPSQTLRPGARLRRCRVNPKTITDESCSTRGHCGARFGRGSGRDRDSKRAFRTAGGVAVSVERRQGSGDGRQDRTRFADRAGGGTSVRRCCKCLSHPTDACRSVGAERNREPLLRSSSSHPFRPRGRRRHCSHACPVAGGGSVSSAVERSAAPLLARSRFDQPGVGCGSRRLVG